MRSRRHVALTAILLTLVTTGSRLDAQSWSLFNQFSTTTNPSGAWRYGSAPTLGGTFTLSTVSASTVDGVHAGVVGWRASATSPFVPVVAINTTGSEINDGNVVQPTGAVLVHGEGVGPKAAVVQWIAPTSGLYQLVSSFTGAQISMKANVGVFSNSSSVFSGFIQGNGGTTSFSSLLSLTAGTVLSFAVNRDGPETNGFAGNWTALAVNITSVSSVVPEPTTYALMLTGLGGLAFVRRRRRV
jgi:PEP-CTERM motif